ncbi:NAD-dependent epimerase/dehydratase family protein [Clostridium felsineum]|uniref:NAD-dependent epimerase/dehydratase family protein n=1 Tax=Clostridium felsineum TaxID=36839 RepID=UPI00098C968C|nr:NAD-dependent epimerase/dehydratase family protein [Clostridium felsineum]
MEKTVLTGATGYICSNLTKRLIESKKEVYIIARSNSKFDMLHEVLDKVNIFIYDGNILNLIDYFNKVEPDSVCHLASLFISEHRSEDVDALFDSNIRFSTEALEAMNKAKVHKLINLGIAWQNYNNEIYNPVWLYEATKEAFEKIIDYYVQANNFKFIILKIFDTYEPNDNRSKIINMLEKCSKNKSVIKMSKGEQLIDLTYIDDIVRGFYIALLNSDKIGKQYFYEKYVLHSIKGYKLKDMVFIYEEVTGRKVLVEWGEKPYRRRKVMNPSTLISIVPCWNAEISLKTGLKYMDEINNLNNVGDIRNG